MARETNTRPLPGGARFIVPVEAAGSRPGPALDDEMGGKARSLARLAALGLPVPPAFAVRPTLWRSLRAGGPPLPRTLATTGDLTALEAARQALQVAPWPAGFVPELEAALTSLTSGASVLPGEEGARRFSVRSSADIEDRAGHLGAGLYSSLIAVERAEVPAAVREVLASFLGPAAWSYALAGRRRGAAGDGPGVAGQIGQAAAKGEKDGCGGAVLIHPFVEGDTWGTAAAEAAPATGAEQRSGVRVEARAGTPTALARARIEQAVQAAVRVHGPVEIEWAASEDSVVFLQMRSYQAAPAAASAVPEGSAARDGGGKPGGSARLGVVTTPEGEWIWDGAHNPAPLSPAQAGLVELVDGLCRLPFRQRVVDGYLFWKTAGEQPGPAASAVLGTVEARDKLEKLRLAVDAALDVLGAAPALEAALGVYVGAYEPLFGLVGPACAAARAAFTDFLKRHLPSFLPRLPLLLAGVPSVATRRRDAVRAVIDMDIDRDGDRDRDNDGDAGTPPRRQTAVDDYLRQFGDESPRWDVSEPTLREAPQRLLLLMASRSARADAASVAAPPAQPRFDRERSEARAALPAGQQARFDQLLAAARVAVAVGEDDDALFARLQAAVRRALLAVGERLVAAGNLDASDDVFYLPLAVTRAAALASAMANAKTTSAAPGPLGEVVAERLSAFAPPPPPPPLSAPPARHELRRLVIEGRLAVRQSTRGRPLVDTADRLASLVRGQGGAGGRMVGRAVHHPALEPLGEQSVLIADTLLPTELPLLTPGAVVVETGHVLGHVAAQARERGIPAVVGAAGALAAIPDGSMVAVDGDRGEVVLLGD